MNIRSLLNRRARVGFTLIELLLVIGIIAILASIVIVAINPNRQLGQSRDAQRRSDVNTLLNAIYQYSIDNNGKLPGSLTGTTACTATEGCQICKNMDKTNSPTTCGSMADYTAMAYLSSYLTGSYIVAMPQDPRLKSLTTISGAITGYKVYKDSNNRITVWSPYAEVDKPATGADSRANAYIKVTR